MLRWEYPSMFYIFLSVSYIKTSNPWAHVFVCCAPSKSTPKYVTEEARVSLRRDYLTLYILLSSTACFFATNLGILHQNMAISTLMSLCAGNISLHSTFFCLSPISKSITSNSMFFCCTSGKSTLKYPRYKIHVSLA